MKSRFALEAAVAAIVASAFAASADLADDAVTVDAFPDADTVLLDDVERVKYRPDGTYESVCETRTKILTERGRRSEQLQRLHYSARYGTARFDEVVIECAKGGRRVVDLTSSVKETTDNSSMYSNIVDPLDRKLICNVGDLAIGDVVSVKWRRVTTKSRVENEFSDRFVFEGVQPAVRSLYEVTAPAERPLAAKAVRKPIGNVVESSRSLPDGSTVHIFAATNTPRMFPEPDMPQHWKECQHVVVSTVSDWRDFSRWYWKLSLPHLERTSEEMTNMVRRLKTPEAIFRFVSQEVRYMGLTMEDKAPGYAPHDVSITFDNRYGVCRDKAALLVSMLRIGGYNAYPVLINVGAKLDEEIPVPFFNHAIVAVEKGGEYSLMDPTNENTKDPFPSYLCNLSYLVARPEGDVLRVSPMPDPKKNSVEAVSSATLDSDGNMAYRTLVSFGGINDTAYRGALAKMTPEARRKFFERRVRGLSPSAELVECAVEPADVRDTAQPLKVRIVAKLPDMALKGESRVELSVPFATRVLGLVGALLRDNTALEKRKYPLILDTTVGVEETLEIDLGGALGEAVSLPRDEKTQGVFSYERTFRAEKGILRATRSMALNTVEISPEEYLDLREALKEREIAERRRCIFAVDRLENADVRRIAYERDVTTGDYGFWTTTNRLVKEVLTYKGLKTSSEIKIPYNPETREVEILEASVSNRNGQVFCASKRETNLMDATWSAAAPRYPAGKLLVVNLPGVEVGSVISFKTAVKTKNCPIPFSSRFYFDSFEPTDRLRLRVDGFSREETNVRRLKDEGAIPDGALWRDSKAISLCDWRAVAERMKVASRVAPCSRVKGDAKEIRDFMAKNVRVIGPGVFDLPFEKHITSPERVLDERYASSLDYIRTLASLLKGSGIEAKVVFAAGNGGEDPELRRIIKEVAPEPEEFDVPLCMAKVDGRTVFIGTENEYTPIGATDCDGADYFDPETAQFGVVEAADGFADFTREVVKIELRENGTMDYSFERLIYGTGAGTFRKKYSEMLPEDRSRHFQGILSGVAHAASATSDLTTDVESYPARQAFSCYVPMYASVDAGVMSVPIPVMDATLPSMPRTVRKAPVDAGSAQKGEETVVVVFPKGYREIEHVPESLTICDPSDPSCKWLSVDVEKKMENGRLVVIVRRTMERRDSEMLSPDYAVLLREWGERISSRSANLVSAREVISR